MIDHPAHPLARRIADVLRRAEGRRRTFLIDDEDNIRQALRCGVRLEGVYSTGDGTAIMALAGVPSYVVTEDVAKVLFGAEKRSRVFAMARTPPPCALDDVTARPGDVVVLDGVRLVGNIGAVARSVCAFGAAGIVLVNSGLTSTVDRRLVRASRGFVFAVPVVLARNDELRAHLAERRIPVASLRADAATPLAAVRDVGGRLALLLGSERQGASAGMDEHAEWQFRVPTDPLVESLNVSVAAALALYERRSCAPAPPR